MSGQCLNRVWKVPGPPTGKVKTSHVNKSNYVLTVSGPILKGVWKVYDTEIFGHTFFAKLSPDPATAGLKLALILFGPPTHHWNSS